MALPDKSGNLETLRTLEDMASIIDRSFSQRRRRRVWNLRASRSLKKRDLRIPGKSPPPLLEQPSVLKKCAIARDPRCTVSLLVPLLLFPSGASVAPRRAVARARPPARSPLAVTRCYKRCLTDGRGELARRGPRLPLPNFAVSRRYVLLPRQRPHVLGAHVYPLLSGSAWKILTFRGPNCGTTSAHISQISLPANALVGVRSWPPGTFGLSSSPWRNVSPSARTAGPFGTAPPCHRAAVAGLSPLALVDAPRRVFTFWGLKRPNSDRNDPAKFGRIWLDSGWHLRKFGRFSIVAEFGQT